MYECMRPISVFETFLWFQAKSLTSEFKNAWTLVNPVALFRFSAVDNVSVKGILVIEILL